MKNGGYAIISHDDVNIFNKIDSAYKAQKPILFYDDDKNCFYVDSVKVNGDGDYEFTKGGKTWTVTDNNTLSSEGQIQEKIHEYIINLILKSASDGSGVTIDVSFRYITNKELTLYNNEHLTQEIANSVVDDYRFIPLCEEGDEVIQYAYNEKFIDNCLNVRGNNSEFFIVDNSTITIIKLF